MITNKMMFKNYIFDHNPTQVVFKTSKNISESKIPDGVTIVREISSNPAVVVCKGNIFGDNCLEKVYQLKMLHQKKDAGILFIPNMDAMNAIFSQFNFELNSQKNSAKYELTFVESPKEKKEKFCFGYTFAKNGENAFDIAYREGVTVDKIMCLNDFETPFSVNEWDKVITNDILY